MISSKFWRFAARSLRCLPPEFAHNLAIRSLSLDLDRILPSPGPNTISDAFQVAPSQNLRLSHPITLAAGFDKQGECFPALYRLGFSAVEIGTVTPLPQSGNPKPRMFRQPEQLGLINRMGFNSQGIDRCVSRLRNKATGTGILGANVGKNKATPNADALQDFLQGLHAFADYSDYLVVNVSSPNTPGLRDLASPDFVKQLAQSAKEHLPKLWIKFDPDLAKRELQELTEVVAAQNFAGLILSNTHRVEWPEAGGQSGHPIAVRSAKCLEWAYEVHRGSIGMIASGGIFSGTDVLERLARGASAVQIYSALIYRGATVVRDLLTEVEREMQLRGIERLSECIGSYYNS